MTLTPNAWAAEVAHEATESSPSGLSAIGIDASALLFQLVNFAILLWLLKRFAYRPIVKLLEARRQKIEESLKTAEEVAARQAALERERVQVIAKAEGEASALLARSKQEATMLLQAAQDKGRQAAEAALVQAASHIEGQRQELRHSLKAETLNLVRRATERILRQKLDDKADAHIIESALKES